MVCLGEGSCDVEGWNVGDMLCIVDWCYVVFDWWSGFVWYDVCIGCVMCEYFDGYC